MNRILRGAVVFAASALFVGCNTEPEAIEGGVPDHIIANPSTVIVENGDSTEVLVRLVDQQGTSLPNSITFSGIGAGISLGIDSLFRPVFAPDGSLTANPNATELRVYVKGTGLAATSFTITAADKTLEVPVTVLPTVLEGATFSNTTPATDEVVVLTAPAGFSFNETSTVTFAIGQPGQIVDVADDGSTISFIPKPKAEGAITVTDITPGYAPTLRIPLTLSSEITVSEDSPYSSDAPGTAPTIAAPALGETINMTLIQIAPDQFTNITIPEAGTTLDITLNWVGGADVDFFFCNADLTGCASAPLGGNQARTGAHPEHMEVSFAAAGTYVFVSQLYSGAADYYDLSIRRIAPPAP